MNRLFLVFGFALVPAAHAHHSHYVDFLPDSNTAVRGTIERVYWSNPHIRWDMIAEDGERWLLHVQPNPAMATRAGMTKVWINRRHDVEGLGATAPPEGEFTIEMEYNSMADFVKAHQEALG